MAAPLRSSLQQTKPFCRLQLLETHLSCFQSQWMQATSSNSISILNKRNKSSKSWKSKKVPEDVVQAPYRVTRMLYNRLVNRLTTSVDKLETRMPKTYKVYKTFRTGVSSFITDTKQYYKITSDLWNGESMSRFTRRELELYRQFSSDLPVMAMVLIIAFAPGGAFIFPVAYMFPRYLLSPHFWTKEQKEEFRRLEMVKRLSYYPTIVDMMYHKAKGAVDERLIKKAVNKLSTSVALSSQEIVSLKPIFREKPFSLDSVTLQYRWLLSRSLGMSFRRNKLVKEALLIRYIDVALRREGIHNLTDDDLNRACAWRGLIPDGLDRDAKLSYLEKWTKVTADVRDDVGKQHP